jgi:4-carboxymuconolactone decarboxylase
VFDAIAESRGDLTGPFRIWLHSPEFADRAQQLGKLVRYETRLESRLSELAILVTARAWDCQLEWTLHEPFAVEAGLSPELLEAIRLGQYPEFERDDEQTVYDYVAELVYNRFVQERTFAHALELLNDAGVVELTGLIGYYSMAAMTLNAFQVPLPKGTKPTLVDCPTFR